MGFATQWVKFNCRFSSKLARDQSKDADMLSRESQDPQGVNIEFSFRKNIKDKCSPGALIDSELVDVDSVLPINVAVNW